MVVMKNIPRLNVYWRIYWWNGMLSEPACLASQAGLTCPWLRSALCSFWAWAEGGTAHFSPGGSQDQTGQKPGKEPLGPVSCRLCLLRSHCPKPVMWLPRVGGAGGSLYHLEPWLCCVWFHWQRKSEVGSNRSNCHRSRKKKGCMRWH